MNNCNFPKVGIRPTIDGRRKGVRESLEKQTMQMAISVSELISSSLKYSNGENVQCVISDTTIGGVAEASRCADKFKKENVGLTITVTPCWCYGSETIDMDPTMPKAIWGFNGTERPGAVYLAAALAGHSQLGLPAFGIYGRDVQEANCTEIPEDVKEKLLRFTKAGIAAATMRGKSYLSLGSVSMGIAGSIVDQKFFQKYLGMRNEYVDMTEILRRMNEGIYDPNEYEKALKWVKKNCKEGFDRNSPKNQKTREEKDKLWEDVVKMTLIAKDLMIGNPNLEKLGYKEESEGHNAIAAGFQGQRHWTDHLPNGDFMEAILNSSFDWNGIREAFVFATENDSLNAVPMLFGHLLTNTAQIFADVRTYWSPDAIKNLTRKNLPENCKHGFIHLINSGAATLDATGRQKDENGNPIMKPYWDINENEVKDCLDATLWCPAVSEYFRGGGYSSKFISKADMPLTMSRICIVDGIGPVLQIAEGYSIELDEETTKLIDNRTDSSWPTTWFVPNLTGEGSFKDVYSVMNNWGANHGAISYGHIGADLITLASILRIPVSMHNVSEEKIFRPSAWSMFGTKDLEGSDFRACKNFGPLYK
ncbi:L-fucose isomerase [Clostridium fallax]|uniref:L-fucose isomerase n=1 Tax=Clostridium fallax TaxID=1533 RepID=A0A1M4XCK0_9CLOT|nr:L-fucose isomerase [Clostridium fallax]SHE91170.1 L-fucose isomerase [Clostridium fallax]SQB05980.1 L-fucose isomerase [Clostridium fallax]